jgi:hypothetical protein
METFSSTRESMAHDIFNKVKNGTLLRLFAGCVLLPLLAAWPAAGQVSSSPPDTQEPEIVTDRPDVTESSIVVPVGSLQFENGLTWTTDHKTQFVDFSQTLIRIGILDKTELRFVVPDDMRGVSSIPIQSGFGDVVIGIKQQLGPIWGDIDLSVIAAVSIPSGAHAVSSGGYDPFVKFPWSKDLLHGFSVGGMQSLFLNTDRNRRDGVWEATFYLEKQLSKRMDAFMEYAGDYSHRGGSEHMAHFGTAFRFHGANQADFHFGFGLNRESPDHFLAVGYSVRFDHIWK